MKFASNVPSISLRTLVTSRAAFVALLSLALVARTLLSVSVAVAQDEAKDEYANFKIFFQPLPALPDISGDPLALERVELGRKLFFETSLSLAQGISCNTCHSLKNFGVDGDPVSTGHNKQKGTRNSPTVYNASLHIAQFWDGRAKDVEEQALGPILNPIEMGMPANVDAVERLKKQPKYVEQFKKAFPDDPDPVSFDNIGKAIGAFERRLLTPSRFDEFLKGKNSALSPEEKKGLKTFVETGCTTCHMGVPIGGLMYQKLGLVVPYVTADLGRYEVTKNEADKYVFKVPSLRNVTKTGPYFHDGSVKTIEEAIRLMAKHQLGRDLNDEQVKDIKSFLGSLTGTLPAEFLK